MSVERLLCDCGSCIVVTDTETCDVCSCCGAQMTERETIDVLCIRYDEVERCNRRDELADMASVRSFMQWELMGSSRRRISEQLAQACRRLKQVILDKHHIRQ